MLIPRFPSKILTFPMISLLSASIWTLRAPKRNMRNLGDFPFYESYELLWTVRVIPRPIPTIEVRFMMCLDSSDSFYRSKYPGVLWGPREMPYTPRKNHPISRSSSSPDQDISIFYRFFKDYASFCGLLE